MTVTCGGKELKRNRIDILVLGMLGMDIPVMESLKSDICFEFENIATDAAFAVTCTCMSC
jgi:hypothetical protein